jgi:hypothetical protein
MIMFDDAESLKNEPISSASRAWANEHLPSLQLEKLRSLYLAYVSDYLKIKTLLYEVSHRKFYRCPEMHGLMASDKNVYLKIFVSPNRSNTLIGYRCSSILQAYSQASTMKTIITSVTERKTIFL